MRVCRTHAMYSVGQRERCRLSRAVFAFSIKLGSSVPNLSYCPVLLLFRSHLYTRSLSLSLSLVLSTGFKRWCAASLIQTRNPIIDKRNLHQWSRKKRYTLNTPTLTPDLLHEPKQRANPAQTMIHRSHQTVVHIPKLVEIW